MKKIDLMKKGACIGVAVFMLGACGQAGSADPAPTEAVVESSVEETVVQEEKETTVAKESDAEKEETEKETEKEDSAEDKENQEDAENKESADAEKESSGEKEETSSADKESIAAEETKTESSDAAQGTGKSVSAIYEEISQSVALNSPMLVPDDFIMNYYGIDVSTLEEYVFSMSEAAISAETVVILKAKDAGSTGALSASLQMVIDQKRSEMENYLPDQFQIVDKSSVQVQGNYVYLVISSQADAINRIIQADIP